MNNCSVFFLLRSIVSLLLVCFCSASARASGQPPILDQTVKKLNQAKGPERYTHVRAIWRLWDEVDPVLVEGALNDLSNSPMLEAPLRSYAAFLAAHARTRLGDPTSAVQRVRALGFSDRWLVVGPFDNEGKGGFDYEYGPEVQFGTPLVAGRAFSGKERAVRWRRVPNAFPYGWLDGSALFRPEQQVCFYATTFVRHSGARATKATVWIGTLGAFKLFLNGQLLLQDAVYRGHDIDRHSVHVRLAPGKHALTVKACGTNETPIISLRVGDERGAPGSNFSFSAEFSDSSDLAEQPPLNQPTHDLGPLSKLEKRLANNLTSPATLEAFARYLRATDSDDPTAHIARDYARRAAVEQPTIERLLLAGELAEDYNQERVWIERAEALAREQGKRPVELLLARARVEKSGLNWRDAFPYYDQALATDPNNTDALLGKVHLLNEAQLKRTALATLRAASTQRPNALALQRALAKQLRSVGQRWEAERVEERYSHHRFAPVGVLTDRMELALARGNQAAAEHWLERLIALNPSSLWVRSLAARTYRRLGQPMRARSAYEFALKLAPEDVGLLRAFSDFLGEQGKRDEQLRLLRQILTIQPQAKDVHEYVQHIEPDKPKQDEAYAVLPKEFLKERSRPANGESKRTLIDLNVKTVFDNGLSSHFRQVVFQPLTDSAAALSRNFIFSFQADRQRVQLRGARVFRSDGRIDEAVETGTGAANDPSIAMYTSARTFNVQFPRLEPQDVVELRYRIDDVAARNEFDDYFGDIHYMESSEAVHRAEYVLITPIARQFYIDHQGIPNLKRKVLKSDTQRIFQFRADNVAPVIPEPSMAPWSEVLGFIHVSTYPNYQAVAKWYWGLAKDQFDLDDQTRKIAREVTANLKTTRQKVAAIYNWVIKNTRYVALEFGIYGFKPRRCVQTVSRGWGDCKDKAVVIVSMLRELGIESTIVILRTQMRGNFQSKVASLAPFDHAIAYVPALDLYLDGTAEFTGSTELPAMDQGALGILVNEGQAKLVSLPLLNPENNLRQRKIEIQLKPDGAAELKLAFMTHGVHAPSWRQRYTAKATLRERISLDLAREFPGLELRSGPLGVNAQLSDFEQPVRLALRGTSANYARLEGGNLSLAVTTRQRLTDRFASLSARKLNVRVPIFGTVQDRFEVDLPSNMVMLSGPTNIKHAGKFGSFEVKRVVDNRRVIIESRITLKVTRVTPAVYPEWRRFCEAVDAAMAPRLIVGRR